MNINMNMNMNTNTNRRLVFCVMSIMIWVCIIPCHAETGDILISDDVVLAYTNTDLTYTSGGGIVWSTVFVDVANYNYISSFRVSPAGASFGNSGGSTSFTFVSGATGSGGWIYYDQNLSYVKYVFFSDMVVVSSPIELLFADANVMNNVSMPDLHSGTSAVSSGMPIKVYKLKSCGGCIGTVSGAYSDVVIGMRGVDTYIVDYPLAGHFRINVDKTTLLLTKYILLSETTEYWRETYGGGYTSTDITNVMLPYADGLIINATLASGLYTKVWVNSSGASSSFGYDDGALDPIVVGVNGYGIRAHPSTVYTSQVVNISWKRTASSCIGCIDYIMYLRPKPMGEYWGAIHAVAADAGNYFFVLSMSPQNEGHYHIVAETPGVYGAAFVSCLFGVCTGDSKAADSFTVLSDQPSYILVNATVPVGKLFSVGYSVGFVSAYSPQIRVYHLENNMWETYDTLFMSSTYAVNTVYYTTTRLGDVGTYMMKLCDAATEYCSQGVQVKAIYQDVPTHTNITSSLLSMDSDTYFFDETAHITTIVDDTNYSRSVYLEVLNENGQTTYVSSVPGQWWDYSEQISPEKYFSGNNTLRMISKNDTTTVLVLTVNFSITETDMYGNGMKTDKMVYCMKEKGLITVTTLDGNLSLVVSDPRTRDETYRINHSVKLSYVFAYNGTYYLRLWSGTDIVRMVVVSVNDCVADEKAAAAGDAGSLGGVTSFIGSTTFLSIIILITFMVIGFTMGGAIGGVASIGAAIPILAFGGLIPSWIVFLEGGIVFICIAILCATHITKSG